MLVVFLSIAFPDLSFLAFFAVAMPLRPRPASSSVVQQQAPSLTTPESTEAMALPAILPTTTSRKAVRNIVSSVYNKEQQTR